MKASALGGLFGASLIVAALCVVSQVFAQRPDPQSSGGDLITMSAPAGDGLQQLTVIDPRSRVMSVYHLDTATGEISLKSVRNITWDLQMMEFNAASPLPREVRSMLE